MESGRNWWANMSKQSWYPAPATNPNAHATHSPTTARPHKGWAIFRCVRLLAVPAWNPCSVRRAVEWNAIACCGLLAVSGRGIPTAQAGHPVFRYLPVPQSLASATAASNRGETDASLDPAVICRRRRAGRRWRADAGEHFRPRRRHHQGPDTAGRQLRRQSSARVQDLLVVRVDGNV